MSVLCWSNLNSFNLGTAYLPVLCFAFSSNRRTGTSFPAAFSNLPPSNCSMANNSVSDDESTASSWNLSASNVVLCEEEIGIIPLPAEEETDRQSLHAAPQPLLASAAEPFVPRSSSGSVCTALSGSNQRHVTPAVPKRDAPVADVPMVCACGSAVHCLLIIMN